MPARRHPAIGRLLSTPLLCLGVSCLGFAADPPIDAATIMAKVAANVESATEARRQYVYRQQVRSSRCAPTESCRARKSANTR